jgi:hypothetical protein
MHPKGPRRTVPFCPDCQGGLLWIWNLSRASQSMKPTWGCGTEPMWKGRAEPVCRSMAGMDRSLATAGFSLLIPRTLPLICHLCPFCIACLPKAPNTKLAFPFLHLSSAYSNTSLPHLYLLDSSALFWDFQRGQPSLTSQNYSSMVLWKTPVGSFSTSPAVAWRLWVGKAPHLSCSSISCQTMYP